MCRRETSDKRGEVMNEVLEIVVSDRQLITVFISDASKLHTACD